MINNLATCEWVKKGEPLCLIGDSGTGKSHLLIGLGTAAAMEGHRVRRPCPGRACAPGTATAPYLGLRLVREYGLGALRKLSSHRLFLQQTGTEKSVLVGLT